MTTLVHLYVNDDGAIIAQLVDVPDGCESFDKATTRTFPTREQAQAWVEGLTVEKAAND